MRSCTFFGHKDTPYNVEDKIRGAIEELIIKENVTRFYVGNHGNFDFMVLKILREAEIKYPHIAYNVVLAYLPDGAIDYKGKDIYPQGIEAVPKRFAISWRNNWMLSPCDFVVAYITHTWGGAYKFTEKAIKQNKTLINLAEQG